MSGARIPEASIVFVDTVEPPPAVGLRYGFKGSYTTDYPTIIWVFANWTRLDELREVVRHEAAHLAFARTHTAEESAGDSGPSEDFALAFERVRKPRRCSPANCVTGVTVPYTRQGDDGEARSTMTTNETFEGPALDLRMKSPTGPTELRHLRVGTFDPHRGRGWCHGVAARLQAHGSATHGNSTLPGAVVVLGG